VLLRFFNSVDLLGVSARVEETAAVARKALLRVTGLGDCESITFMLSKGV
jgi:hypothetical protein